MGCPLSVSSAQELRRYCIWLPFLRWIGNFCSVMTAFFIVPFWTLSPDADLITTLTTLPTLTQVPDLP